MALREVVKMNVAEASVRFPITVIVRVLLVSGFRVRLPEISGGRIEAGNRTACFWSFPQSFRELRPRKWKEK